MTRSGDAGWGPIHADLARHLAAAMTGAQWRYVITDPAGRAQRTGLIHTRPTPARQSRTTDTVELQAPAALLTHLTRDAGVAGRRAGGRRADRLR